MLCVRLMQKYFRFCCHFHDLGPLNVVFSQLIASNYCHQILTAFLRRILGWSISLPWNTNSQISSKCYLIVHRYMLDVKRNNAHILMASTEKSICKICLHQPIVSYRVCRLYIYIHNRIIMEVNATRRNGTRHSICTRTPCVI